ncbi:Vps52 / Sac2 family protein [Besnoitia besnoiti]|uniref:Vps52 / Sac2 family protein n=1 Tax=Besnoitia besnoiti TaxID=94643 RepID=A0A2A9MNR7_BESBE|nr:Vps52 / Sac2 family protein [Besnoitia besnoiti]PFH37906.1 Vps52 / Sac2 family protein [Besnoitia besnoiti]
MAAAALPRRAPLFPGDLQADESGEEAFSASGSSSLESMTARLRSLDLDSLASFLKRFSDDPRLLLALRLPANARNAGAPPGSSPSAGAVSGAPSEDATAVAAVAAQPLEFHQLYASIDCLLMLYETQALQLYGRSYPQMLELQEHLQESEAALEALEAKLGGVRGDLRRTGEKIKVVEDESIRLGTMMTNRREAGVVMKTFLQQITVERELVKVICEGTVSGNPAFVAALKQLTKKIEHARQPGMQELKSASASLPELQKLRECALSRISSHLSAKLALLRQPRTNVHIIQQNDLLKSSDLFLFLLDHNPAAALAFKDSYTRTISQVYVHLFRVYVQQLRRLQTQRDGTVFGAGGVGPQSAGAAAAVLVGAGMGGEEVELLASRETAKTSSTFANSAKQVMGFMMSKLNTAAAPSVSLSKGSVFWSHQKLLIDTATREFLFLTGFFLNAGLDCPYEKLFAEAFGKSLAFFVDLAESAANSHDALGVLLMLRVTHYNTQVMQRRRIPCLNDYLRRIHVIFNSALRAILSANIASLVKASPRALMADQSEDVRTQPHFVTRRFAELASALESIRATPLPQRAQSSALKSVEKDRPEEEETYDAALMREMLDAALDLIVRLSQEIPTKRERTIFLINNFDLLLNIFHQRQVLPDACTSIEKQLYEQISFFVEEQLQRHFGALLAAVTQAEEAQGGKGDGAVKEGLAGFDAQQLESAVVQFGADWRERLGEMHSEAVAAFSNFTNGMETLKLTLTQLLLLHTRLHQVVNALYPKPPVPAWVRQLLPTNAILAEIRSLSRGV